MDNRPYIKWYCEKLKELLDQDPNNPQLENLNDRIGDFLGNTSVHRIEAQVPPGITVDSE